MDTHVVEFVRLGYQHDTSFCFHSVLRDWDTFRACLEAAGGYNEFYPSAVVKAFAEVFDDLASIAFGREGSPVMYLDLPYWTHQRLRFAVGTGRQDSEHRKYTAAERWGLARGVRLVGQAVHADEIDAFGIGGVPVDWNGSGIEPVRVRLWWD